MKRAYLSITLFVSALAVLVAAGAAYAASGQRNSPAAAPQPYGYSAARIAGGLGVLPMEGTATATPCAVTYICLGPQSTTITPGTTDTGNHCDDCVTNVTLPFPVQLYGVLYTSLNVSSNGNAQFVSENIEFNNTCLPFADMGPTIFAYWDDLDTEGTTCTGGCGIYTSVSGSAPNRVFHIEWRTFYFSEPGNAYFEIRLFESTATFDVVIGTVNTSATATIGVQDGQGRFTQCICNTAPPTNSLIRFAASGNCPVATATSTPPGVAATATANITAVASSTSAPPTATLTSLPIPTSTSVPPTASPGPPTPCANQFSDVPASDPFYAYIRCLSCRNIISGYSDGTFRPGNNITRGQISKMVSNAAGFDDPIPAGTQTYADVSSVNTFWLWIERLTLHSVMSGYTCGGAGEPCDPQNRPYFRWANNATRAQLCKIVSNTANFQENHTEQTFTDVPTTHPFYQWIERLVSREVISGYNCGGPGEPCDPQNRPYFRPYNNVTRGQASKIVANTFYPNCQTPQR